MNQNEENNQDQTIQLTDLPLNDEQAEQTKGGTELKYNFAGIEGAAGACMQDTEKGVAGMFA